MKNSYDKIIIMKRRSLLILICIVIIFLFVVAMYAVREVVDHDTGMAFDRILTTRWTTRCPQEAGQYFELDLGQVYNIGKVELLSQALLDYPRGVRFFTSLDMGEVVKISAIELNAERESKDQPAVLE